MKLLLCFTTCLLASFICMAQNDSASQKKSSDKNIFTDNISYADTNVFNISIKQSSNKMMITLCPDPTTDSTACTTKNVSSSIKKGAFVKLLQKMIKQNLNIDTVVTDDVSPSLEDEFDKINKADNSNASEEKTGIEKDVEDIKNNLAKEKDTTSKVGVIHLKNTSITIYDDKGGKTQSTIDSVTFSIESGKLSRKLLYVQTKDGRFYNKDAPIPVIRINERGTDQLDNIEPGNKNYVLLKDVLLYENTGGYVPDDVDNAVLDKDHKRYVLVASSNLSSLINFSLYTDLTGLLGRRPNGLLNTEVTGKFITNTSNITNRDITPLSFIEPNIVLSKFDSKFQSIDSSAIKPGRSGEKDTVDRMLLMQRAWLKGSMKFNLLSMRLVSNQYFNINILARINVVKGDSLYKTEKDVLFFDYAPEVQYSINRLKNFGMDLSLRWLQQRIADKESFSNKGWESIFNPQIAFFYFPTNNSNSKLYLRFNYFANKIKDANNFYQLQFGWKTGINFGGK